MKIIKYALILFVLVAWHPARSLAQSVSYERILHSQSEPGSWLTYSGSYSSQQYSSLKQINRQNISSLKIAWIYQPSKPV